MTSALIVEDSEPTARALASLVKPVIDEIVIATSLERGLHVLASRRKLHAVFADIHLGAAAPRGGLEILEVARRHDELCVLAAASGVDDDATHNAVARFNGTFLKKPFDRVAVQAVARAARALEPLRPYSQPPPSASAAATERRQREALRVAAELGLTPAQARVLVALAVSRGLSRDEVAANLAMSPETLNNHCRAIRQKAGCPVAMLLERIEEAVLARTA